MKLSTTLNGVTYRFTGITDVLAKANEPKAGDRLIGIAAETATERLAAKVVLSELTVGDLTENPTIPYETDEVTRVNWDGLNQPGYQSMKNMTIGELREWVLDHKTTPDVLKRSGRNFTGEVAAAVAKIMTSMDLVYGASRYQYTTHCNTEIGQRGTISYRCQTNSTTDDPETIVLGLAEGVSFGCGDACLGINPVNDDAANTKRIAEAVYEFMTRNEIPTQVVVLSHITTQMEALRRGAPLSMIFQSIAGTQATNDDFGVSRALLEEAYDLVKQFGLCQGANLLYFETGQGSEVSVGRDQGVDEMTLEARTYGFGRFFRPFMVNNVTGFIGPETIYDGKEMIRAKPGGPLHGQVPRPADGDGAVLDQPHLHHHGRPAAGDHAAGDGRRHLLHGDPARRRRDAGLPGHQLPRRRHPAGVTGPHGRPRVPPLDGVARTVRRARRPDRTGR